MQAVRSRIILSPLTYLLVLVGCGSGSGAQTTASLTIAGSIIAEAGTPQSAALSTTFAAPLVAQVQDQDGHPITGVLVSFGVPASGASATFSGNVNTATTGVNGEATSPTISANGVAGTYAVTATAAGVPTPANFSLTNTGPSTSPTNSPGPPVALASISGSGQSAATNTTFITPLTVQVVDGSGNALNTAGIVVTFSVPIAAQVLSSEVE